MSSFDGIGDKHNSSKTRIRSAHASALLKYKIEFPSMQEAENQMLKLAYLEQKMPIRTVIPSSLSKILQ